MKLPAETTLGYEQLMNARPADPEKTSRPPAAEKRPRSFTVHGTTVTDDYAWLKDENWQQVLREPSVLAPDIRRHLEAENAYTDVTLASTVPG